MLALRDCAALQRILPEGTRCRRAATRAASPEIDTGLHILLVVDYAPRRKTTR
jgi:hypothetical protein